MFVTQNIIIMMTREKNKLRTEPTADTLVFIIQALAIITLTVIL